MSRFTYVRIDADGMEHSDHLEAANVQEARRLLLSRNIRYKDLKEVTIQRLSSSSEQEPLASSWKTLSEKPQASLQTPSERLSQIYSEVSLPRTVSYHSLVSTFRLYAGWLLAWYFLLYAFGGYEITRSLPFSVPFVQELLPSPTVATVSFGLFFFLLLTSVHRILRSSVITGIFLALIGIASVVLFGINA